MAGVSAVSRRVKDLLTEERVRFIRFCVVGATGVVVNLGVFSLFMSVVLPSVVADESARFVTCNFIGFVVSVFTNFLLNDFWTWGDRAKHGHAHFWARLGKFYLVSSIAGAVQMGVAYAVRAYAGVPDLLAVLIGIAVATVINFVANNLWTFGDDERADS